MLASYPLLFRIASCNHPTTSYARCLAWVDQGTNPPREDGWLSPGVVFRPSGPFSKRTELPHAGWAGISIAQASRDDNSSHTNRAWNPPATPQQTPIFIRPPVMQVLLPRTGCELHKLHHCRPALLYQRGFRAVSSAAAATEICAPL